MRLPENFEVEIKDLVFGGEGIGHYGDRPVFVFGVLPEEKVLVRPVKVRRKFIKAELVEVLTSSSDRIKPGEEHYLTCSPWQIIPYNLQLQYKKTLTQKMWQNFTGEEYPSKNPVNPSPKEFGYRNKLEFSFNQNKAGKLTVAFHRRYHHSEFYNFEDCLLGAPEINKATRDIVDQLNHNQIDLKDLKNLTLKYSFKENKLLATLYVTNKDFIEINFASPSIAGVRIVYSDPRSPMAIETELLSSSGRDYLTEKLGDFEFKFGSQNFFQVNPAAFVPIIDFTSDKITKGQKLVDLYSGVGVLGIAFGTGFNEINFVEKDPTAKAFNLQNLKLNKIENANVLTGESERQDLSSILVNTDALIVDPPRAGMHPKVLKKIIEAKPSEIIYVSCNPATQARDYKVLKEFYRPVAAGLFDLYPQTPHVESVLILKLI